ncbi:replication protein C, IncQ-type [Eoetvoesiella caeni]
MSRVDVVRVDSALGFNQVFRPLKRVAHGKRPKLDVEFPWKGASIRFSAPNQLDIGDQAVLLAVLQVVQEHAKEACLRAEQTGSSRLERLLELSGTKFGETHVLVEVSLRQLARLVNDSGCAGGSSTARIQQSLVRLAETTVWLKEGKTCGSSRLIGWEVGDEKKVALTVNWRLVGALLGHAYSKVLMTERWMLPGELPKALHFVLSCQLKPGVKRQYGLETLQRLLWGDVPVGAASRQRRVRLLNAVRALGGLEGWCILVKGSLVEITRKQISFAT